MTKPITGFARKFTVDCTMTDGKHLIMPVVAANAEMAKLIAALSLPPRTTATKFEVVDDKPKKKPASLSTTGQVTVLSSCPKE